MYVEAELVCPKNSFFIHTFIFTYFCDNIIIEIQVQRHYANRPNANRPNANWLNANFTISGPMPTVWMPTNPNANLKIELTTPNLT
jgi:hypothetical protein